VPRLTNVLAWFVVFLHDKNGLGYAANRCSLYTE